MNRLIRIFGLRAGLLFIVWLAAYHQWIKPDGRVDTWLTDQVVNGTRAGLTFMGYQASNAVFEQDDIELGRLIYIDGEAVVFVADACNGLELMALFAGFLLAFPGPPKYKAMLIPIGTLAIYLLNIGREIVLALNYKFFQQTFDFNHKYTYVLIVYGAIFLVWRYWLNHYSIIGKKVRHAAQA